MNMPITWTYSAKWNSVTLIIDLKKLYREKLTAKEETIDHMIDKVKEITEEKNIAIKEIKRTENMVLIIFGHIEPNQYGLLDRIVYTLNKYFLKIVKGFISHKLTLYKANEEIPDAIKVSFLKLSEEVPDRRKRYKILNAFANYLSYTYGLISARINSRHIGIANISGEEYEIGEPFEYEGKTYHFEYKKLLNITNKEYWYDLFLQQYLNRYIKRTFQKNGFILIGNLVLDPNLKSVIDEIVVCKGFRFMSLIYDNSFAISIRPVQKIFTNASLWDYLNRNMDNFLVMQKKFIGSTTYTTNYRKIGNILFFEYDRKKVNCIPNVEIRTKNGERVKKSISEIVISFRFDQLLPAEKKKIKISGVLFKRVPDQYFSRVINLLNPFEIGNLTFTFSDKPLEVIL